VPSAALTRKNDDIEELRLIIKVPQRHHFGHNP
jgi:hypothetical protein